MEDNLSRRSVVVGGTVAAAGSLAACGGSNTGDKGAGAAEKVDFTIDKSQVDVGSGFVVGKHNTVVTQPTEGTFKAFTSVCPHERCQVGRVTSEAIICPCHGSQFDPKTGDVTAGPAQSGLAPKTVKVEGSKLHITG